MKLPYGIIAADLAADMGNRLVSLTLMDMLIFQGKAPLWHMVGLTMAEQGPSILLSPLAGAAADRMGADRLLALSLAGKSIFAAVLLLHLGPWPQLSLYFCFICSSLGFNLGRLALVPELVPPRQIVAFNALNESIALAGGIVAYALVGGIIEAAGQRGALNIAVLCFLAALGTIVRLSVHYRRRHRQIRTKKPSEPPHPAAPEPQSVQGPLYRPYLYLFLLGSAMLAGGALNFTMPILFKWRFQGQIAQWGIMMTLFQGGAFAAALTLQRYSARLDPHRLLTLSFILLSMAMSAMAWIDAQKGWIVLMPMLGAGFTWTQIILESIFQQTAPRRQRGKMAARIVLAQGVCYCGTSLGGVWLLHHYLPDTLLLWGAFVLTAAGVLAFYRTSPVDGNV